MKLFFVISTIFFSGMCCAQYSSAATRLADSIAARENQVIERDPQNLQEIEICHMLQQRLNDYELLRLTNHPHPAVKCYGFWALCEHLPDTLVYLIQTHLNDTGTVKNFHSAYGTQTVPDVFCSLLEESRMLKQRPVLNPGKQRYLDSILVFSDRMPLYARLPAAGRAAARKEWHDRIRELVQKGIDYRAATFLPEYGKEEDVPLIFLLRWYEYKYNQGIYDVWYHTVRAFPHKEFKDTLAKDIWNSFKQRPYDATLSSLYGTIASYRDKWAADLLTQSYYKADGIDSLKKHQEYIENAITWMHDTIYTDLYWKFWEQKESVNGVSTMTLLVSLDKERAYLAAKKCIVNLPARYKDQPYFGTVVDFPKTSQSTDTVPDVYARMLDMVVNREPGRAKELISAGIKSANISILPLYLNAAIKLKHREYIDPLFARFAKENEPEIYFPIAITLLEYRNKEINQRIKPLLKKGGYEWQDESAMELLKEYGIE